MVKLFCLSVVVLTSFGCMKRTKKIDTASSISSVTAGVIQSPFRKVPDGPNLSSGGTGQPTFLSDPVVIRDESGLHMFIYNPFCDLQNDGSLDDGDQLFSASETLACHIAGRAKGATMYAFSGDEGKSWQLRPLTSTPFHA